MPQPTQNILKTVENSETVESQNKCNSKDR
jgi:hypothetical protein